MKVLFILSNRYLFRSIRSSLLIWLATCLSGCLVLYLLKCLLFAPLEAVCLSLVFSSPALLIAIPFLYHLHSIPTIHFKIASAAALILLTSAGIIGFVSFFFNVRYPEVAQALLPFIPSAFICFIFVSWKQLISKTIYK